MNCLLGEPKEVFLSSFYTFVTWSFLASGRLDEPT